eukprot:361839-Chlamydomonas_euryale.AAC.13
MCSGYASNFLSVVDASDTQLVPVSMGTRMGRCPQPSARRHENAPERLTWSRWKMTTWSCR